MTLCLLNMLFAAFKIVFLFNLESLICTNVATWKEIELLNDVLLQGILKVKCKKMARLA